MIYLKLDGEHILGFNSTLSGDYNVPIKADIKELTQNGAGLKYCKKYIGGNLVELSEEEIENHPVLIRSNIIKKIAILKHKEKEKQALKEVRKVEGLTVAEIAIVDELLAELE